MRSVYRLLGLVRRYGPGPVEAACERSLDLDVVSVSKIAAMLAKATEQHQPALPGVAGASHNPEAAGSPAIPANTRPVRPVQLTLIPGGATDQGGSR